MDDNHGAELSGAAGTYLCTVSRSNPDNWTLARDAGMWGLTARRHNLGLLKPGDHLVFWVGGRGYVGQGKVVGPPRAPRSTAEAPWPGGMYVFTTVIPMVVTKELKSPIFLPFDGDKQRDTNLSKGAFRRSLYKVPDDAAKAILNLMDQAPATES
jgi:hypothetical protein